MESPPTGSLLDPLARTESCGHFLLQRKLGKLVLEQKKKKKKMGLPWAFCCLDQGKKKSKELTVSAWEASKVGIRSSIPQSTQRDKAARHEAIWGHVWAHIRKRAKTEHLSGWMCMDILAAVREWWGVGAVGRGSQGWRLEGKEQEEKGWVKGTLLL